MAQKKYKKYNALSLQLKRSGIKKYGTVARLLLDCFLHLDGQIKADYVESKNLCKNGEFKKWRKTLEDTGYLAPWKFGDYSRHSPGPKLTEIINEEKASQFELATIQDIMASEKRSEEKYITIDKYKELLDEINTLKSAIEKINVEDPPITPAKIEDFMLRRSKNKISDNFNFPQKSSH